MGMETYGDDGGDDGGGGDGGGGGGAPAAAAASDAGTVARLDGAVGSASRGALGSSRGCGFKLDSFIHGRAPQLRAHCQHSVFYTVARPVCLLEDRGQAFVLLPNHCRPSGTGESHNRWRRVLAGAR
jgi:hypothetical protein